MVELTVAVVVSLGVLFFVWKELKKRNGTYDVVLVLFSGSCVVISVILMALWRKNYFFLPTAMFLLVLSVVGVVFLAYHRAKLL